MDWDVFISHAWEDKEDIARPLAEALRRKGLRVWYDEFTLTLGDSLRRSIDRGLAQSRYGIVILSRHFFAKEWPQKELDGLAAREVPGEKVILPVWHNITAEQVREYSPTLADRVAVSSDRGLGYVVKELLCVIKPTELVCPIVLERVQLFEPEMVLIPAGKFRMGSDPNVDKNAIDREQPQYPLYLPDYYLAKTPVTNAQYAAFVQDTGRKPPSHWKGDQYPEELRNHPVVNVSWSDAVAYCKWLSKKTGKPYRLPSEAEWEKAARGTDGRRFPWGDEWDVSKCNTRESGTGTTTTVGQYSPDGDSPYGVADMAGNVWEWCADWLQPYPGNSSPDDDYGETHKVLRGSSWKTYGLAHCAFRYARRPDDPSNDIGFRCAKSSPPAPAKTRQPVNWEKVGAIAQVIALLIAVIGVPIALGTWLWPNAADFIFARPSETPTVTPTSGPTHIPATSTATPTNTPFIPTATPTFTPVSPTPMPLSPSDTPMPILHTLTPTPTNTPVPPTTATTPDGGRIAFLSDRDGNSEIYVMDADGSGQTRLTNDPAADWFPSWSPDGTRIAFMPNRDGNWEIYAMNADGSGQTNLTNSPTWDGEPSWSPDGTRIAFKSDRGNDEVYVMNTDGSGLTPLTNNPAPDVLPSWSPDGTRIAFASYRDGNWEIYAMNADGSGQTNLTNNSASEWSCSWSPDGTRIAFMSKRDGNAEIYMMNADGSGQTNLTNNPAADLWPSWSPDGTRIAFASDRDGNDEIYMMNADGSGQTNLTNNPASDSAPSWSPR